MANISSPDTSRQLSEFFQVIGQPARLQILAALDCQEACVCHLEAVLGMRQAAISQHLMILRNAGLVDTRRDGRHIFYSLSNQGTTQLLAQIAAAAKIDFSALRVPGSPVEGCPCPICNPGMDEKLACKRLNTGSGQKPSQK